MLPLVCPVKRVFCKPRLTWSPLALPGLKETFRNEFSFTDLIQIGVFFESRLPRFRADETIIFCGCFLMEYGTLRTVPPNTDVFLQRL